MKRYLFVCNQNRIRSRFAELYFSQLLKKKKIEAIVESAGILKVSNRKLTRKMTDKADVIFAMEEDIANKIIEKYKQPKEKIVCLNIPNIFDFGGQYFSWMAKWEERKGRYHGEYNGKNIVEVLGTKNLEQYI